jgi:hypothetical protein
MKTFLVASTSTLLLTLALLLSSSERPATAAAQEDLPYTFFFTHYELLGDPNNPEGVRYHSNGKPFAKAPDGSKVTFSGGGEWDPYSKTAEGGGQYTIEDASGEVTARGSWRVTDFSSFEQFDGWWGMGPDFKEKGWQGPPGSPSFSGFLTLKVNLENQGNGTLVAWCLMPEVLERHPHLANPDGHAGDGISLTGGDFNFTDFSETEMSLEGVMFYSTDPASDGYVLTSEGNTVRKTAAGDSTAGATASPSATPSASPTALATTGGASIVWPLTLVAALALVGFGVGGLALLRRSLS